MSEQNSQNRPGRCIKATLYDPRTDTGYRLRATFIMSDTFWHKSLKVPCFLVWWITVMSLSWEALQMDLFLHGEWVYPWEHKHHTHVGPQSHRMHTRRGGISSCLRFEAALPELPVLLNPILKERFTPHVCEAPGIGRECAHKGTHTNTICMPDAMCNHRRKRSHFGSWNSITVCLISEAVLWPTKCSLQLFTTFAPAGGRLLLLRSTIVWVLPHSPPPSSCTSKNFIWQQGLSHWRPI